MDSDNVDGCHAGFRGQSGDPQPEFRWPADSLANLP